MHLPLGGKETVDRLWGKEVRCAVRPIQHADVPQIAVLWDQAFIHRLRRGNRCRRGGRGQCRLRHRQHIRHPQGPSGVTAKLSQSKGRTAAQIDRHVKTIAHRQIGAASVPGAAHRQYLPGPNRHRLPVI
ncbi:hypothetical protein D3C78_1390640 [compost metagenome]